MEKLADMGVIIRPTGSSRKGKAKEVPPEGHVVFVDSKEDCEWLSVIIANGSRVVRTGICTGRERTGGGRGGGPWLGRAREAEATTEGEGAYSGTGV